jgi:hypothetical protein
METYLIGNLLSGKARKLNLVSAFFLKKTEVKSIFLLTRVQSRTMTVATKHLILIK